MGHWSKSHSQPNVRQAVYMKNIILDLVDFPHHLQSYIDVTNDIKLVDNT
jgi:hypothetical protein